jgi:hypothetical protein
MRSQRLLECLSLLHSCCAACGVQCPSVSHHFWACPVAVAVRTTLESQLIACGVVPVGFHLSATDLWLAASRLTPPVSIVWCGIWCVWQPSMPCIEVAALHGLLPLRSLLLFWWSRWRGERQWLLFGVHLLTLLPLLCLNASVRSY